MLRLASLALFMLVTMHAAAQDDVARARQLFTSGLEAARAQRWEEARDDFASSLAIAERPSTLLNLAGAQVQTGQLVEGAASYRRFLEIASEPRDVAHRAEVEAALRSVEPRIPHVTIRVDGLSEGDVVRLDGNTILPAALGARAALDPGAHDVNVTRDGRTISGQHFQLAEGASTEIDLTVAPVEVAVAVTTAETVPMDEAIAMPVAEPPPSDDTGIYIAVGIGVGVAVVIGVVVAALVATQDQGPAPPYMGNFGAGIVRF